MNETGKSGSDYPHIDDIRELYMPDGFPVAGNQHDISDLIRHIDGGGDPWTHRAVIEGVRHMHGPVRLSRNALTDGADD